MVQDERYKLTGSGSEGDPQLGPMSQQQPINPVITNPVITNPINPVVPPPPSTNGTGGGNPPFDPYKDELTQQVFDPNTPTSVLGTNPNVPIPAEQQLEKLT